MNNTFMVTPMNQMISLKPGETYTGFIKVANSGESSDDFAYKVSVAPYSVLGEEYDADLATMSNHSMIVDWISLDKNSGILNPNETSEVYFTITVPSDAPAGGQYASLLVTDDTSSLVGRGSMVNSVFEIASLIYADVAGETVEKGEVLENNIPGWVTSAPIMVNGLLSNNGNVHEIAITTIEARNIITGEKILPTEQNMGRYTEVVMPETTRRTNYNITNLPLIGIVEVKQSIYYNGASSVEIKNVIICPIWFIILAVILICSIIGATVMLIRKRRKTKNN